MCTVNRSSSAPRTGQGVTTDIPVGPACDGEDGQSRRNETESRDRAGSRIRTGITWPLITIHVGPSPGEVREPVTPLRETERPSIGRYLRFSERARLESNQQPTMWKITVSRRPSSGEVGEERRTLLYR